MFDVGWTELFVIAVVALVVIGPKDMPRAMRTLAKGLSKLRGLSREFQSGLAEVMREAELDEIRRKVDAAGRMNVKEHVGGMMDPDGTLRRDLDLADAFRPEPNPTAGGVDARGEDARGDDAGGVDRPRPPPAAVAPAAAYAPPPATDPAVAVTPVASKVVPPPAGAADVPKA